MDILAMRNIMAAIIIQEELRVPFLRGNDMVLTNDRMRKQFRPMIENAYCIVDLMLEVGALTLEAPQT